MNVRQRRAITDSRIMAVAQEQVAVIFAVSKDEQPAAIEEAIRKVTKEESKEVARGCIRVFDAISKQIEAFK